MAIRSNHYDAAFEQYLRSRRTPYVAVDEQRRALAADASLKSFDFIVSRPGGGSWLVDVKGRRFPTGGAGGSRWENWVTAEDVECLLKWETVFGTGSRALFAFAYDLAEGETAGEEPPFAWGGRRYAFFAVSVADYATVMTSRSASWETVNLPRAEFERLRAPFAEFLKPGTDGSGVR